MDCRTARLLLDFCRPLTTELEPSEAEALQCHLADCPECGSLAQAERTADHHLGRAIRAVVVPDGLRDRLVAGLKAAPAPRRRWLWSIADLAAAAVFLIALGLGLERQSLPTKIDASRAMNDVLNRIINPRPESVEEWFESKGVHTTAPPDFNYRFLDHYDLTEFQGRRVPFLLFTRFTPQGREYACVYILSGRQFDAKHALANQDTGGSGCRVSVRRHPTDPGFVYYIVYTGDSLGSFLAESAPSAT